MRLHTSAAGTLAALVMVPAVSIMSSTSTATLPFTSPIRFMTSLTLCALRRLSTMASGASFSFLAKALRAGKCKLSSDMIGASGRVHWCARGNLTMQYFTV